MDHGAASAGCEALFARLKSQEGVGLGMAHRPVLEALAASSAAA